MNQLPADLIFDIAGIDGEPSVNRSVHVFRNNASCFLVDLDFGHGCAVRRQMRAGPNATSRDDLRLRQIRGRRPRLPLGGLRDGIQHSEPARILDIALPERIRVHFKKIGELIDGLLRCEGKRKIQR